MKKLIAFCSTILTLSVINLYGQILEENNKLRGRLIDQSSLKPVSYCHVFNETKRTGRISDSSGYFSISASAGDTLVFIAMSYLGKVFIVPEYYQDSLLTIFLEIRYYAIDEVEYKIPGTYKGFQKALMDVDTEKDKPMPGLPEYNPYIRPQLLDTNVIQSGSFKFHHPVSALYYNHSKIEQSKRKLRYLQEQELHQPEVDAKYNKEMLSRVTGFTGDTLLNFMLYCNFSFNYLYEATELEIIEEIDRRKVKFIEYCYGQCIPVTQSKRNRKSSK